MKTTETTMPNGMTVSEYQDFVTENHSLIWKFIRSKDLDEEEFYDLAAIGFCKAAQLYNESLGYTFGTFSFKCMENEINHYFQIQGRKKRSLYSTCSLNAIEEDGDTQFASINSDFLDRLIGQDIFERFYDILTDVEKEICKLRIAGYTCYHIAETLGKTHQRITQILKKMKVKYDEIYNAEAG